MLQYADHRGLDVIVNALRGLAARMGERYNPAALLVRMAEQVRCYGFVCVCICMLNGCVFLRVLLPLYGCASLRFSFSYPQGAKFYPNRPNVPYKERTSPRARL